jgi:hypothetical protein
VRDVNDWNMNVLTFIVLGGLKKIIYQPLIRACISSNKSGSFIEILAGGF